MKRTYTLSGVVHPERTDVRIDGATALVSGLGVEGAPSLHYSIYKSRIAATCVSERGEIHPNFLRAFCEKAVRANVDALGFTNGCAYEVEVTQLIEVETNKHWVFGVNNPAVEALRISDRMSANEVASLNNTPLGYVTQRCFADLRQALRAYEDTPFYCYRAIESVMQYFRSKTESHSKSDGWALLRATLGVKEEKVRQIQAAATPVRHGDTPFGEGVPREKILTSTWKIIERFVSYALSEKTG